MKKLIVASALALLAAPAAWGQYYLPRPVTNPFDRPTPFSPYGGYGPYGSYSTGTIATFGASGRFTDAQIVQQLQLLQQQQQQLLAGQALGGVTSIGQTGHPTRFGSYRQYFFNLNGSGLVTSPGLATTTPINTAPGFLPQNVSRPGVAPVRPPLGAPPVGTGY